jgi:hypothetical protein
MGSYRISSSKYDICSSSADREEKMQHFAFEVNASMLL